MKYLAQAIELDQARRAMSSRPVLHPTFTGKRPRPRESDGPLKGRRHSLRGSLKRLTRAAYEVRVALEIAAERERRELRIEQRANDQRWSMNEETRLALFAKLPSIVKIRARITNELKEQEKNRG